MRYKHPTMLPIYLRCSLLFQLLLIAQSASSLLCVFQTSPIRRAELKHRQPSKQMGRRGTNTGGINKPEAVCSKRAAQACTENVADSMEEEGELVRIKNRGKGPFSFSFLFIKLIYNITGKIYRAAPSPLPFFFFFWHLGYVHIHASRPTTHATCTCMHTGHGLHTFKSIYTV